MLVTLVFRHFLDLASQQASLVREFADRAGLFGMAARALLCYFSS